MALLLHALVPLSFASVSAAWQRLQLKFDVLRSKWLFEEEQWIREISSGTSDAHLCSAESWTADIVAQITEVNTCNAWICRMLAKGDAHQVQECLFLLHHSVFDGWSADLLLRDFSLLLDNPCVALDACPEVQPCRDAFRKCCTTLLQEGRPTPALERNREPWRRFSSH
jgi:hypothetical protein